MNSKLEKQRSGGLAALAKVPVIVWGLLALLMILGIVSPNSVRPTHLTDFLRQAAPMIIVGIGQTIVMMVGGLDLSVASTMILVDIIACKVMANNPANVLQAVVICVLVGVAIGLVNGLMCAKLRMPPFVVTLGMSTLLTGITLIYCDGAPKGSIPSNFRFLGNGFAGMLPMAAIVWLIMLGIMLFVMKLLPVGKIITCTGVNEYAVYQAGKDSSMIQILCYVLCGLFAALAGLQVAAYVGTGSLELGYDYQNLSIATAILGGAAFSGGKGSVSGTAMAGLFMVVMYSLVAVLNLSAGMQSIIQGAIILAGLLLNAARKESAN